MSTKYPPLIVKQKLIQTLVDEVLFKKIMRAAQSEGRSVASYVRRTLALALGDRTNK